MTMTNIRAQVAAEMQHDLNRLMAKHAPILAENNPRVITRVALALDAIGDRIEEENLKQGRICGDTMAWDCHGVQDDACVPLDDTYVAEIREGRVQEWVLLPTDSVPQDDENRTLPEYRPLKDG